MKHYYRTLMMVLCLATQLAGNASAANAGPGPIKIRVCRREAQLVKLAPNPTSTGTLSVASETADVVHFYVFDVAGNLAYHAMLLPHNRRTISDLRQGDYTYDVFRNDESVEQGKITVLPGKGRKKKATSKHGIL